MIFLRLKKRSNADQSYDGLCFEMCNVFIRKGRLYKLQEKLDRYFEENTIADIMVGDYKLDLRLKG